MPTGWATSRPAWRTWPRASQGCVVRLRKELGAGAIETRPQATLAAVEKDEGPVWWVTRFRLGEGTDEAGLARALALEDPDRPRRMNFCPTFVAKLIHRWSHRVLPGGVGRGAASRAAVPCPGSHRPRSSSARPRHRPQRLVDHVAARSGSPNINSSCARATSRSNRQASTSSAGTTRHYLCNLEAGRAQPRERVRPQFADGPYQGRYQRQPPSRRWGATTVRSGVRVRGEAGPWLPGRGLPVPGVRQDGRWRSG